MNGMSAADRWETYSKLRRGAAIACIALTFVIMGTALWRHGIRADRLIDADNLRWCCIDVAVATVFGWLGGKLGGWSR